MQIICSQPPVGEGVSEPVSFCSNQKTLFLGLSIMYKSQAPPDLAKKILIYSRTKLSRYEKHEDTGSW